MKPILYYLLQEKINASNSSIFGDERFRKHQDRTIRCFRELTADLDPDMSIIDDLENSGTPIHLVKDTNRFIYGYRLGVLMAAEIFQGRDLLIANPNYDE